MLEFFQGSNARVYPVDHELEGYCKYFVMTKTRERATFNEMMKEESDSVGTVWDPLITFARMLMQASMMPLAERELMDGPSIVDTEYSEINNDLGSRRKVTRIDVLESRIHAALKVQADAASAGSDELLVVMLQKNGLLYSTTKKVLNQLAIALNHTRDQQALRLRVTSGTLLQRMKWIECVSMQYYVDRVYWGRSDERKMTLRRIMDARSGGLAYLVESLA